MKIGQLGSKLLFTLIGNSFLKLKSKEAKSKNTNRIQVTLKVFFVWTNQYFVLPIKEDQMNLDL